MVINVYCKIIHHSFFILLVSLAGRRWGTKVAGILSGMPVVAGPIVVLMAIDQGDGIWFKCSDSGYFRCCLFTKFWYCLLLAQSILSLGVSFLGGILVWIITATLLTFYHRICMW
jgi:uncharacterized membrane protein (GlpM family)